MGRGGGCKMIKINQNLEALSYVLLTTYIPNFIVIRQKKKREKKWPGRGFTIGPFFRKIFPAHLILPSLIPFLYGVAVLDEPLPLISILYFLFTYSPQMHVVPYTVSPSLPWPSSPSSTLDFHLHRTSSNMVILSSQQVSMHLSLPSCTFFDISTTLVDPLIYSFLILSSLVIPDIHLNILISATSIFFSSVFFILAVSVPYSMAGLITVLWNFPFSFNGTLLSQRNREADLQLFHPACIRCLTSSSMLTLTSTLAPRYLNLCTFFISSPSILILSLLSPSMLAHIYSVLDLLILI